MLENRPSAMSHKKFSRLDVSSSNRIKRLESSEKILDKRSKVKNSNFELLILTIDRLF